MRIETVKYVCDLCKTETKEIQLINIPVAFVTEQTEGRTVTPYLSTKAIDVCSGCHEKIIENYPIKGAGAQGHNRYWLNSKIKQEDGAE